MEADKRRFVRKRTDQLLYAEFGPENGSILLNLSKDGCSFQSIAPVRDEQVHFSVSVGDGRKLEGEGKMVWSDIGKKTGGLRFLNPSAELQEQVCAWLSETLVTADGKLDAAAVESRAKRRRKELREKARAEAKLAWKQGTPNGAPSGIVNGEQAPANRSAAETAASEAPAPPVISAGWPDEAAVRLGHGNARGSWWGLGTLAVIALIFWGLITYRREFGHWVMSVGSSLAGEQKGGVAGGPTEVSPAPETPRVEVQPAALLDVQDTKEPEPEPVSVSNDQETLASEQTGPVKRVPIPLASTAEDVRSLWSSVENGDTRAEVTLANRYVRGEGVPQSCAQARVLLEAAVKRGNGEAKQKLDGLPRAGCP